MHDRLAVLTSPDNTPDRIARLLIIANLQNCFQMSVAENLATSNENIVVGHSVSELADRTFSDPNVVLLWRTAPQNKPVQFGYADDRFQQRYPEKGLITKREARAVSLARLQLRADSVVWDIGAGSGSVGVEAALLCPMGHVYAVEKNAADCDNARANSVAFGLHNYSLVHAKAPEGLDGFPDPDAVFIGGSGGELSQLITLIIERLRNDGHLVMNFVTFENLSVALDTLKTVESSKKLFIEWDITQLQSSRSKPILDMQRLAAENPVFIVCVSKKEAA
jgi:precorrin-6Y C5,15-methyltransferase (decarboxylating)